MALFDELNVPICQSNMSFGASVRGGEIEYGLRNFNPICSAKKSQKFNYLKMLMDILKLNKKAVALATDKSMTIRELLNKLGTGKWFRDYYLLPFLAPYGPHLKTKY